MKIENTPLKDCFIIHDTVHGDERGYFIETFNQRDFETATGLDIVFVQDNQTYSTKGVLRGLHFQFGEFAQSKLIRVISGAVLDVVVDLRKNSNTFGQHISIELNSENQKQLFIPRGFAHGFLVISETVFFSYKCDNFYNKNYEGGILFNDNSLTIDWTIPHSNILLSNKDKQLPSLEQAMSDGLSF